MEVSVVIPAYNEQENLTVAVKVLSSVIGGFTSSFELVFVNDGSSDDTERMPEAREVADVLRIDLHTGQAETLARTTAWNWQQGCMLQWLGPDFASGVVFNDCADGRHVAVAVAANASGCSLTSARSPRKSIVGWSMLRVAT